MSDPAAWCGGYGSGSYDERFLAVAQRILDGDDSIDAANELEGVVRDDYPGDECFDERRNACLVRTPVSGGSRQWRRRLVFGGSGSDSSEEPVWGCEPVAPESESCPRCPPRARP